MQKEECVHQWLVWQRHENKDLEVRWCHICNEKEERPREFNYQKNWVQESVNW